MIVKYKVSDFAKDLNLSAKKVLDELAAMGSTGKKNSSNLEENELNYLLEKFSKAGSVAITASTATRSPSSIRSARKRPFPSANWHVRPAQRLPLPPHRLFLSAARTIRSPWIPALWI